MQLKKIKNGIGLLIHRFSELLSDPLNSYFISGQLIISEQIVQIVIQAPNLVCSLPHDIGCSKPWGLSVGPLWALWRQRHHITSHGPTS